ncbi:AGROH133_08824 family phage infection protein [Aureimonas frigidaquae]|uniref:AGROH133_08824 family phage infection protein n=1 Tax=Aureimonas frigidaquae TaxID=424757 RepID=UPI000784B476|nr:DUF4345 family protein [Aureimonas frigidaquae]
MEFSLPITNADWLPFIAACVTILGGLTCLFAPGLSLRRAGIAPGQARPAALAQIRSSIGGFWLGAGFAGILFYDQPIAQLVLGLAWAFAAFGRFVSMLSDSGLNAFNWVALIAQLILAFLFLGPVFGLVPA